MQCTSFLMKLNIYYSIMEKTNVRVDKSILASQKRSIIYRLCFQETRAPPTKKNKTGKRNKASQKLISITAHLPQLPFSLLRPPSHSFAPPGLFGFIHTFNKHMTSFFVDCNMPKSFELLFFRATSAATIKLCAGRRVHS